MMTEVIVFPDVEDLLVGHLTVQLPMYGGPSTVSVQVPNPRPTEFVTIPRVGGTAGGLVVDTATLSVDSWAATPARALEIAQIVRGVLHASVGTILGGSYPVYRVDEFSGPANQPDPLSQHYRYTQTMSVWVRGRASGPV